MSWNRHPIELDLPASQLTAWEEHGWIILESLFPAELVERVNDHVERYGFPKTRGFEPSVEDSQFDFMATFPFRCREANDIAVSNTLSSVARQLLGESAVQLYQAQLWRKLGGHAEYEQSHHRDYAKNTMLTPRDENGQCDFLSFIVYLTDVRAVNGPTALVSRSMVSKLPLEPGRVTRNDAPELYEREYLACAPKGSALFYAGDTFHRATALRDGATRLVLKGAVRRTQATWVSYVHSLRIGFEPEWSAFVRDATTQQLEFLLGQRVVSRLRLANEVRYQTATEVGSTAESTDPRP